MDSLAHIPYSNDCYLEMLITHLAGKCKSPGKKQQQQQTLPPHLLTRPSQLITVDKEARDVLKSPRILEWLEAAVVRWETGHCPEPHAMAFTIRLTGLVIENEWQFSLVKEKRILERIQAVLRALPSAKQTPTVQLANAVLMNAVARHTMGLHWIRQGGAWRAIVEYCAKNQTVYVVRESLAFLYTILRQFSMHIGDQAFVEEILQTVCAPIMEGNPFKDLESKTEDTVILVDDHEQLSRIVPALNMVR